MYKQKQKKAYRLQPISGMLPFTILVILLIAGITNISAQNKTVKLSDKKSSVGEVLEIIENQTGYLFVYKSGEIDLTRMVEVDSYNKTAASILKTIFRNTGISYRMKGNNIILIPAGGKHIKTQDEKTISGKIVDPEGIPVIGASVQVRGTNKGTISDFDGNFTIRAMRGDILDITYIGYVKKSIKLGDDTRLNIQLKEDTKVLDEVVVTGYGTFKKSAYAGSASILKTDKLEDVPTISFQQMLEGSTPGVSVSAASGVPGACMSMRIRGMGSFNASNSPLYVIDGVPTLKGNIGTSGSDSGLDVMATLNTSDIESISVIKDAAAASLYGSRAANGVVLITTKSGRQGKPQFRYKSDWGWSDFAMPFREIMGGQERRNLIHEGLRNYAESFKGIDLEEGLYDNMTKEQIWAYADQHIDEYAPVPWCGFTDWDDYMFRKGHHSNYEVSASGATEKLRFYTSLGYLKQDGVTIHSGLERISGRMNVDYNLTDKMKVGARILFSRVNQDGYSEGFTYTSPIYGTRNGVTPSDPIWNEDGTWNRDLIKLGDRNPLLANKYNFKRDYVIRAFNTVYGMYEVVKNLQLKTTFSYDFIMNKSRSWKDPRTSDGDKKNGSFSKDYNDT